MTEQGTHSTSNIQWIERYTGAERWLHWVHTGAFLVLFLTGFPLYAGFLQALVVGESGQLLGLIHRGAAVVFMCVGVAYVLVEPRRLIQNIRDVGFSRYDIGWFKAAIPYYLFGDHSKMPPQGRWNTGEKINVLVQAGGGLVFIVTGLVMWFGKGLVPPDLFMLSVTLHSLAMLATVAMFIVHLYLVMAHPLMWGALVSMRFGVASEEFIKGHHTKWYKEQLEDAGKR